MVVAVLHTNAPNSRMVLKMKIWPVAPVAANSRRSISLPVAHVPPDKPVSLLPVSGAGVIHTDEGTVDVRGGELDEEDDAARDFAVHQRADKHEERAVRVSVEHHLER